ncbi:hypothetical protein Ddc_15501 [Ditylenchus destructor]|nr:hypothetical protein Ddc_15501 [Ditylenchus destructor]
MGCAYAVAPPTLPQYYKPNQHTLLSCSLRGSVRDIRTKYTLLKRTLVAEQLKVLSSTVSALAKITYTIDGNKLHANVEYTGTLGQNGTKNPKTKLSSTAVTYTKVNQALQGNKVGLSRSKIMFGMGW